jgi:hypothetical protein
MAASPRSRLLARGLHRLACGYPGSSRPGPVVNHPLCVTLGADRVTAGWLRRHLALPTLCASRSAQELGQPAVRGATSAALNAAIF